MLVLATASEAQRPHWFVDHQFIPSMRITGNNENVCVWSPLFVNKYNDKLHINYLILCWILGDSFFFSFLILLFLLLFFFLYFSQLINITLLNSPNI